MLWIIFNHFIWPCAIDRRWLLDAVPLDPYVRFSNMMTRAFLLLLAMVTGLSAGQAVASPRGGHGQASLAASIERTAPVARHIAKRQITYLVFALPVLQPTAWSNPATDPDCVAPATACTHISDRSRV